LQTFHPEKVKELERPAVPLQSSVSLKTPESCLFTLELGRRRRKGRKHPREVPGSSRSTFPPRDFLPDGVSDSSQDGADGL